MTHLARPRPIETLDKAASLLIKARDLTRPYYDDGRVGAATADPAVLKGLHSEVDKIVEEALALLAGFDFEADKLADEAEFAEKERVAEEERVAADAKAEADARATAEAEAALGEPSNP